MTVKQDGRLDPTNANLEQPHGSCANRFTMSIYHILLGQAEQVRKELWRESINLGKITPTGIYCKRLRIPGAHKSVQFVIESQSQKVHNQCTPAQTNLWVNSPFFQIQLLMAEKIYLLIIHGKGR